MTISPVITVGTPAIQVQTNSALSYSSIIESLGPIVIISKTLYYSASSISQFNNSIQYQYYEINGNLKYQLMVTPIDPRQTYPSMYLNLDEKGIVFDGYGVLNFNLLPGEQINLFFYGKQKENADFLSADEQGNIQKAIKDTDKKGFFKVDPAAQKVPTDNPLQLPLTITNNTAATLPVSILQQGNSSDIANAVTNYSWDISPVVYSTLDFSIQAKFSGAAAFTTYNATMQAGNASSLAAALNTLGIGLFWIEVISGTTYLKTNNDNIIYADLTVGDAPPADCYLDWENNTLIVGGSLQIELNAVNVVNSPNPGPASGTIPGLTDPDSIDIFVQSSPGETTQFNVFKTLAIAPFTSYLLHAAAVGPGASDSWSIDVDTNYNYLVQWG